MWVMIQINANFRDGKRVAGAKFHDRFIDKIESRVKQLKEETTGRPCNKPIFIERYIPCAEVGDENAKYLSGYLYVRYEMHDNIYVKKVIENMTYNNIPDEKMEMVKQRSKTKNIEKDEIKENDAVRIMEEGDFYGFDGRVTKIEGNFCEVSVMIFNQDCIVKLELSKVQKVTNNVESYSLKIIK
jgi:transcription antitermination factor NusG